MQTNNFNNLEDVFNINISKLENILRKVLLTILLIATTLSVLVGIIYSINGVNNMNILNIFEGLFIALMSILLVKDTLKALANSK